MPRPKTGYSTILVLTEIRDFIKYKQAKALTKGKKLTTSAVIQKAFDALYEKDIKSFRKYQKLESGEEE